MCCRCSQGYQRFGQEGEALGQYSRIGEKSAEKCPIKQHCIFYKKMGVKVIAARLVQTYAPTTCQRNTERTGQPVKHRNAIKVRLERKPEIGRLNVIGRCKSSNLRGKTLHFT